MTRLKRAIKLPIEIGEEEGCLFFKLKPGDWFKCGDARVVYVRKEGLCISVAIVAPKEVVVKRSKFVQAEGVGH